MSYHEGRDDGRHVGLLVGNSKGVSDGTSLGENDGDCVDRLNVGSAVGTLVISYIEM